MSKLKTNTIRHVDGSNDNITLDSSQNVTVEADLTIPDKIIHSGDTNTAIRFPAADTITAETGGSEKVRITSVGEVIINDTAKVADSLFGIKVDPSTHNGIGFKPTSNGSFGALRTINAAGNEVCNIQYDTTNANINFRTSNAEKLRITSTGLIVVNRDGVGGRIDATAGDSSIKISDGNGRSSIKVSDPGSGNSYEWELTTAGNLKAPSGKGIDFSANSHASGMTSELLDGYEEGTWAPDFYYHSSLANVTGHYTKIGRMVHAYFAGTFYSNASDTQFISNLPFTAVNLTQGVGGVARGYQNFDIQDGPEYFVEGNSTKLWFYRDNGVGMPSQDGNGKSFRGMVVYTAAS